MLVVTGLTVVTVFVAGEINGVTATPTVNVNVEVDHMKTNSR